MRKLIDPAGSGRVLLMTAVVVMVIGAIARGTIVEVSVATDKPVYQLGEEVTVSVTAYNPDTEPVTLGWSDTNNASYLLDNVFDRNEGKVFAQEVIIFTIESEDSYTWDLVHGFNEVESYPLGLGTHTVRGEVVGYGLSPTIEFEVVPEPTSLLLLGIGVVGIGAGKHGKSRTGLPTFFQAK